VIKDIDIIKKELLEENKKFNRFVADCKKISVGYDFLFDDLTQFLNDKFLVNNTKLITLMMIEGILHNKTHNKEDKTFSLLFCDINGLKAVNDTLGHSTGDIGIKELATIVKKSIRMNRDTMVDTLFLNEDLKRNIAIRLGGDEFLIILPNCTKEVAQNKVAKRIKDNIESNLENTKNLSLSIGVADTNEVEIPSEINNNALNNYLKNLRDLAEERMYDDKNMIKENAPESEKTRYVMKNLLRISDHLGLDINNDKDFTKLMNYINDTKKYIDETKKK
jgi:diguanylate cyclase (GGDEF)-like protein